MVVLTLQAGRNGSFEVLTLYFLIPYQDQMFAESIQSAELKVGSKDSCSHTAS